MGRFVSDELTESISAALNRKDPEGLIDMGAPHDEYDSEAKIIADAIRNGEDLSAELIKRIFDESFESDHKDVNFYVPVVREVEWELASAERRKSK